MFDWIPDLIAKAYDYALSWVFGIILNAISKFLKMCNDMGAEIFDLPWVNAVVLLAGMLGRFLCITGACIAICELGIEYQEGKANIKQTMLNIFKGFFAAALFYTLPVPVYKFCISLQGTLSGDLSGLFWGEYIESFGDLSVGVISMIAYNGLLSIVLLVMLGYCVIKLFFANIKRGGILLTQIVVGSLYMLSVPRGYSDGFTQWMKQIIALCFTAFMQTTLMFLALMTCKENMVLGLGVALAANEVPRIAQNYGLSTSAKMNVTSIMYSASSIVNISRTLGSLHK